MRASSATWFRVSCVVLLSVACPALTRTATAQAVTGTIEGTVLDDSGASLTGARVTATDQTTGLHRSTTVRPDGRYVVMALPSADEYIVEVEQPGFAPARSEPVWLLADRSVTIDFILRIAAAETVAVEGRRSLLDRGQSVIEQTVNELLVHSLPLFRRDFMQLASLAAGFAGDPDFPNPQGQMYWTNNVLVDGATHFSKWRSAPRSFYSGYGLEPIKEVQVFTSLFAAEYGEGLASVTTAITRSGTNQWQGTALFHLQDDALDAMPPLALTKPNSSSQQYGFSLGGPLIKDRTHVWGSYEARRSRHHNITLSPVAANTFVPDDQDEHLPFVKLTHQMARQLVTARYNAQIFRWHDEPGGLALPGTGTSYRNDVHTLMAIDSLQISDRLLNEARAQFARYTDVRRDLRPSVFVSRAGYSLEGGLLGPLGFGADPEDTWEGADTLSYLRGAHMLKIGGGIKSVRAHTPTFGYGRGAYYFAGPPEAFPQPYLFVQALVRNEGAAVADPRSVAGFGFLQDDWRIRRNLTLNVGLRYDIDDVYNVRGYDAPADRNNFQPRIGAVWDPTGGGRTVVRGGVGIYTQQHLLYPIDLAQIDGPGGVSTISLAPGSPLMPVFPATIGALAPGAVLPPSDVYRVDGGFRNPSSVQMTVGIERTIAGMLLAADYVHLSGRDLLSLIDVNAPASITKPAERSVAEADLTRLIVPVPNTYRKVITLGNLGQSWYRALQVKATRTSGPVQAVASYTWSQALDMANYQLPEDSRNIAAEKGPANTDVTHNATVGITWTPTASIRLLDGWKVSAIGVVRSGRPYTISWGDDRTGTTQNDARPGGRNTVRTGPYRNVDLAVARRFGGRTRSIEARLGVFNLFNATNYNQYVGELASPLFARPVSAFPERRLQLGVSVGF